MGARVLAMTAESDSDLYRTDLSGPVVFVFGNEARGLPSEIIAAADARVRVPQSGRAESLNLAAAATVCLFEWRRRRLPRTGESLENIIAAAAHDIRSPLTAMKGFGYALERRWDVDDRAAAGLMLQGIVHDADRMDTILRQLVDAARVVGGNLEVFREQVDVGELVAGVAQAQRRDPDHPAVEWAGDDAGRLRRSRAAEDRACWRSASHSCGGAATARSSSMPRRRRGTLRLRASRAGADLTPSDVEGLFTPRRAGRGGRQQDRAVRRPGRRRGAGRTVLGHGRRRRADVPLELPAGLPDAASVTPCRDSGENRGR